MLLQADDRVAKRPCRPLFGRTILGGIVARRMTFGAIGEMLDQRRSVVGPRPLRRPVRGRIDGERIIAVHPEPRHAIAQRPRRESRFRSEEHTSELQSLMRISYAVFCLKKKNK